MAKPHTRSTYLYVYCHSKWPLSGFSRSPCEIDTVNLSNIEIREINVDEDDDDDDESLRTNSRGRQMSCQMLECCQRDENSLLISGEDGHAEIDYVHN